MNDKTLVPQNIIAQANFDVYTFSYPYLPTLPQPT